jgi:hypothetical protein
MLNICTNFSGRFLQASHTLPVNEKGTNKLLTAYSSQLPLKSV